MSSDCGRRPWGIRSRSLELNKSAQAGPTPLPVAVLNGGGFFIGGTRQMSTLFTVVVLLGTTAINVAGSTLLKYAGESGTIAAATVGCACYCVGAAGFLFLATLNGLAVTAVATALMSLLATVVVGMLFFGESLSELQMVGIGMAVLAVILVSLPTSS